MAVRVTQVVLQVLHAGKQGVTGFGDGDFIHDYTAFDLHAGAAYTVETGLTLEGVVGGGAYFLAGFTPHDGMVVQGTYGLEAFARHDGNTLQGTYTLNAYAQQDGVVGEVEYQLQAFIESTGRHYGNYDLNAFQPEEQVFDSEYNLQVYLLAQGYLGGLYDIEVFADLVMHAISSYALEIFEQRDASVGEFTYDLNAWEARNAAIGVHYALNTLLELTGYLDTESAIAVFEQLDKKYGVHYDLSAYLALDQFTNFSYDIEVLTLAQARIGSHYTLEIFKAFDGFVDSTAVLNAYEQQDGFLNATYDLDVYVSLTGAVDGQYLLEALQAHTGAVNGLYLLDTTQELFTWVVNQENGAPSRYEGYDFDAYAQIGQDFLAARGDGIFLLSGDDDDGINIDALATIGRTDFDEAVMKRVTGAYLGLNSAGVVHLTIRTDQGISTGPYKLRQMPSASTTERAKVRRGLKSRYWEFDIENVDGGDLQLKSAEFETVFLGRRLKK
jgi:hypothetical protein